MPSHLAPSPGSFPLSIRNDLNGYARRATMAALSWLAFQSVQALSGAAHAESFLGDGIDLRATLSSEAAISLDDAELQKWDFVLEPELTVDLGSLGQLTAIGRLRADPVDKLEPGRPAGQQNVRVPVSRRGFVGNSIDAELRELYLDTNIGPAFLRLGKQQVVWGEADGLRVLDLINPLNFREFILPDFEDRRIPTWMANIEVPIGNFSAQFLWIPDHTYDETPEPGATFAFTSPRFLPSVHPELVGTVPVTVNDIDRPDRIIRDDDYGVRLTGFTGGWDFSVNYLYHHQDQPVFFREALLAGGLAFNPSFERTHVIGGSGSTAFGKYTLRAEAAYSTDRYFLTTDPQDANGVFDTGEFSYILGIDYMPTGDWFVSGQIFQSILTERPDGATRDRVDSTLSVLVTRELQNETVAFDAQWLQGLNDSDGQISLKARYDLRDNVVLSFGAYVFYGDREGLFGQFKNADRIAIGVEHGF